MQGDKIFGPFLRYLKIMTFILLRCILVNWNSSF